MKLVNNSIKWGSLILALVSANAFAQTATTGTIMIEKSSTSDDSAVFSFDVRDNLYPDFTLSGGLANISPDLAPAVYHITEVAKAGWHVSDITCDLYANPQSSVIIYNSTSGVPASEQAAGYQAGDDSVRVVLAANEVVECHFTNEAEGTIKIIKRVKHNGLERLPENGLFPFAADLASDEELDLLFNLSDGTIRVFQDAPQGLNTIYELAPRGLNLATANATDTVDLFWDVTDIECRCVKTSADDECESTWEFDLEDSILDTTGTSDPFADEERTTRASVTIDLRGGELVICEFFNEDQPCPPGDDTSGGTGANNNNGGTTASNNTNAGLATTNVGASAGGCSSTGTGVAGLSTILLLLSSLVGVRAMRRVRVKN